MEKHFWIKITQILCFLIKHELFQMTTESYVLWFLKYKTILYVCIGFILEGPTKCVVMIAISAVLNINLCLYILNIVPINEFDVTCFWYYIWFRLKAVKENCLLLTWFVLVNELFGLAMRSCFIHGACLVIHQQFGIVSRAFLLLFVALAVYKPESQKTSVFKLVRTILILQVRLLFFACRFINIALIHIWKLEFYNKINVKLYNGWFDLKLRNQACNTELVKIFF